MIVRLFDGPTCGGGELMRGAENCSVRKKQKILNFLV